MTPTEAKIQLKLIAVIIADIVVYSLIVGSGLDVDGKIFAAFCLGVVGNVIYFRWGGKV